MSELPKVKKRSRGRPRVLTPQLIAEFCNLLTRCLYVDSVADFLGLDRSTIRRWTIRGRKEAERLAKDLAADPDANEAIYLDFFTLKKRALAAGEIRDNEALIKASGTGAWQAAAWRLERRFPEKYSNHKHELRELQRLFTQQEKDLTEMERTVASLAQKFGGSPGDGASPT